MLILIVSGPLCLASSMQPHQNNQSNNNNNSNNTNSNGTHTNSNTDTFSKYALSYAQIDGLVFAYLKSRGYHSAINAITTDLVDSKQLNVGILFLFSVQGLMDNILIIFTVYRRSNLNI